MGKADYEERLLHFERELNNIKHEYPIINLSDSLTDTKALEFIKRKESPIDVLYNRKRRPPMLHAFHQLLSLYAIVNFLYTIEFSDYSEIPFERYKFLMQKYVLRNSGVLLTLETLSKRKRKALALGEIEYFRTTVISFAKISKGLFGKVLVDYNEFLKYQASLNTHELDLTLFNNEDLLEKLATDHHVLDRLLKENSIHQGESDNSAQKSIGIGNVNADNNTNENQPVDGDNKTNDSSGALDQNSSKYNDDYGKVTASSIVRTESELWSNFYLDNINQIIVHFLAIMSKNKFSAKLSSGTQGSLKHSILKFISLLEKHDIKIKFTNVIPNLKPEYMTRIFKSFHKSLNQKVIFSKATSSVIGAYLAETSGQTATLEEEPIYIDLDEMEDYYDSVSQNASDKSSNIHPDNVARESADEHNKLVPLESVISKILWPLEDCFQKIEAIKSGKPIYIEID